MNYKEELELQKNAIIDVLTTLKDSVKPHDCERCGEMYFDQSICYKCKEEDNKIKLNKIPYWEKRLQECEQKILKAEDDASSA